MGKKLLFLLYITFSVTHLHSQEVADAMVYFHNSDSHSVKIMRPNNRDDYNERIVVVKKEAINITTSKWVTDTIYYPNDIKGFTLQRYTDSYLSKNLQGETLFLKEIVNNENIKVFSKLLGDSELFYLETPESKQLIEIGSNIEPYKSLLIGKSELNPKVFDRMKLNENDLRNGFKASNNSNHKYLPAPFQLGILLGYNRAVLPKTEEKRGDSDNVFLYGIYANFKVNSNPKFNLRPELYYSEDKYISNSSLLRKSIALPLMVRYSFIDERKIIPYVEVGPSINFCLNANHYTYTLPSVGSHGLIRETATLVYFGAATGLGAEIPVTHRYSIYIGFRYHYTYMNSFNINNWIFTISGNIF